MTKNLKFIVPVIIVVSMLSSGVSYATKHIINVQNYSFSPSNITDVIVGDTMRWVWISGSHTTTSTVIPGNAATWNSPISSTVTSFEYKVTVAGEYNYKCTPHASMGMVGAFTASAPAATLSVSPSNQNVGSVAGTTMFTVTSNSNWTASSDADWCSVTPSGSENGSASAVYAENTTKATRIASITFTVAGLTPQVVTVTQDVSALSVIETPGSGVKIYPNPSKGNVFISLGDLAGHEATVTIYSANGTEMITRKMLTNEDSNFDLKSLPTGIYFVQIKTNLGIKTERLVIVG